MQKPPENRRLASFPFGRASSDEDDGDGENLGCEGDDARGRGFHDTHCFYLCCWGASSLPGLI
jgi:hypothetical protein